VGEAEVRSIEVSDGKMELSILGFSWRPSHLTETPHVEILTPVRDASP